MQIDVTGPLAVEASIHQPGAMAGDPAPYAGAASFTFVRVTVRDADGVMGNGFTGRFMAPEVAHFLNRGVAEALVEWDGGDPLPALAAHFNPRGMTGVVVSALSALEIALFDLAGLRAGNSVAALLGGRRDAVAAHVTCGFPSLETDALVEACAREAEAGARGVKVLVAAKGRSVAEDVARLSAVREAIGDGVELIADANCGMDLETARTFVRAVAPVGLSWLEEPVRANDRQALAALADMNVVPLGAGQMEQSLDRLWVLSGAGVSVIQPNAVFLGGIGAAVRAGREAVAEGRRLAPAGGWDLVNLHWMAGAMDAGEVELHRAQARIARMLLPDLPELTGGRLSPPDAPGLGLVPDEDALLHCRIG